jgi:hypothetical protein
MRCRERETLLAKLTSRQFLTYPFPRCVERTWVIDPIGRARRFPAAADVFDPSASLRAAYLGNRRLANYVAPACDPAFEQSYRGIERTILDRRAAVDDAVKVS